MGELSKSGVTESRPFTHVGIDYCRSLFIKEKRRLNEKSIKVLIEFAFQIGRLSQAMSLLFNTFFRTFSSYVIRNIMRRLMEHL